MNPDIRTGLYATVTDGKIRDIIRKFMNFYRYPSTERQESVTKKKKRSWASTYKYKRKKKSQAGIHVV